jgi:hypothetical protein
LRAERCCGAARNYDLLDRPQTVRGQVLAQPFARYAYLGADRVLERRNEVNNTRLTFLTGLADTGYDGLRRPVQPRHLGTGPETLIVGFTHTYDRENNKLTEGKPHNAPNDEA